VRSGTRSAPTTYAAFIAQACRRSFCLLRLKKASRSPRFAGTSQSLHSGLLSVSPAQGSIGCFSVGFKIASRRAGYRSAGRGCRARRFSRLIGPSDSVIARASTRAKVYALPVLAFGAVGLVAGCAQKARKPPWLDLGEGDRRSVTSATPSERDLRERMRRDRRNQPDDGADDDRMHRDVGTPTIEKHRGDRRRQRPRPNRATDRRLKERPWRSVITAWI
jgi:hypothetical protein